MRPIGTEGSLLKKLLTLQSLWIVFLFTFFTSSQARGIRPSGCNRTNIYGLRVNTSRTIYSAASTIYFDPFFAQILDKAVWPIRVYKESINLTRVIPGAGLVVQGRRSRWTNSRGYAVFTGLYAVSPRVDEYLFQFSMCNNNTFTHFVHITIVPGSPSELRWAPTPMTHLLLDGDPPIPFAFTMYDAAGNVVTDLHGNIATIYGAANTGTKNIYSRMENGKATFPGGKFVFPLNSVVTLTGQVAGFNSIQTPSITTRVITCTTRFTLATSLRTFSSQIFRNLTVLGHFPYGPRRRYRCKHGNRRYQAKWIDSCRIMCPLDVRQPTNALLEVSRDGYSYYTVDKVSLAGPPAGLIVVQSPKGPVLTQRYVTFILTIYVVDKNDNKLLLNYPPPFAGRENRFSTLRCDASSNKNTFNRFLLTPTKLFGKFPIVDGVVTLNMTFYYPDPGLYSIRCNTTLYAFESGTWVERKIRDIRANVTIGETCPTSPQVYSISGCEPQSVMVPDALYDCPTNGSARITINGQGFGRKGAQAYIGALPCMNTTHDVADPETKLYAYCNGTNSYNNTLRVQLFTTAFANNTRNFKVRFRPKPVINRITGCLYNFTPSTQGCFFNGTSTVTIFGQNFGDRNAEVRFYYPASIPTSVPFIKCATVTHGLFGLSLTCKGFAGEGEDFSVAVINRWNEIEISSVVMMSYIRRPVVPCPITNGVYCNNKGVCNTVNGTCNCTNSPTLGRWGGLGCETCATGFFGSTCTSPCPSTVADGICSLRGQCQEGVTGNGTCLCTTGYGGLSCEQVCPGGTSLPCSGHGKCSQNTTTPFCICNNDTSGGYWNGSVCNVCLNGYVGSDCKQQCPRNSTNATCSGHGTCSSTTTSAVCTCTSPYCGTACNLTGADCGVCATGKYGSSCQYSCPGYPNSCTGRGTCGEGVQGSGLCSCVSGYAGSNCEITCVGGASNPCTGHGSCSSSTGQCSCTSGYSTSDCSVVCPGFLAGSVCSGNGVCNEGSSGTGLCSCRFGYYGLNCEGICPAGIIIPCNRHGTCHPVAGNCSCYGNLTHGYWAGATCTECQTDWWGVFCNGTCPKYNGVQCGNKGKCSHELKCTCFSSSSTGFWAGDACQSCQPGYYGSNCDKQCPGGACAPCTFHGTCSDGVTGSGLCTCYADGARGYWQGNSRCSECSTGMFGTYCTNYCPQTNGVICSGHGSCNQGYRGDGKCVCLTSSSTGYYGGASCETCADGYYGSNCSQSCPGVIPCSGHGTCFGGFTGNGTCLCQKTYTGADCSNTCPRIGGLQCSGNGDCVEINGTAVCACVRSEGRGYWNGTNCASCASGYFGRGCIQSCPRYNGTKNGTVCSGHGTCSDGLSGFGNCTCQNGWAGKRCEIMCAGGASNPCSGHGTCKPMSGDCTCTQDPVKGFYSGRACSVCAPLYQSSRCTIRCPTKTAFDSLPCSGRGTCFNGNCFCNTGYCGDACDKSGFDCTDNCPDGYWGSSCQFQCPGSPSVCSGHGFCSEGKKGSGKCTCYTGYWDIGCGAQCPGGASTPCSNHGSCNVNTGACTCDSGWGTSTCATECPGGFKTPCNNHGECDATATCKCSKGWAGKACQILCPGGAQNTCAGHGSCNSLTGECLCTKDSNLGYWNGTKCTGCAPGYFGSTCLTKCIRGRTRGQVCVCNPGWSGSACDVPCPGIDPTTLKGAKCSGHGNCTSGNHLAQGVCTCRTNFYTADCSVECSRLKCASAPYYMKNSMCDKATGQCACASSPEAGYWTDPSTQCSTCATFYWGKDCKKICPCRNHGSCNQNTGVCNCFDSDSQGHYTGQQCERCKEGYIGASCKSRDVTITRNSPASSLVKVKDLEAPFVFVDPQYGILYSGGRPIVLFNQSTSRTLTTTDLGGTATAGAIVQGQNAIRITLCKIDGNPNKNSQRVVLIQRGLVQGKVKVIQMGNVFVTKTADFGGGSKRRLQAYSKLNEIITVATINNDITQESYIVMSSGAVSRTRGVDPIEDIVFSKYFDQVSCAAFTYSLLIDPQRLIIGGTKGGTWSMIGVSMPSLTGNVDVVQKFLNVPECANGVCLNVGGIVCDGTYVLTVMHTTTGMMIVRFRYSQLSVGALSETSKIIDGSDASTSYNVTAMLIDTLSNAGFVAINTDSDPSTLYKFDLITLTVYGTVRFTRQGSTREIVRGLYRDEATRTLYASIPMDLQQNVVPLNMYAVTKIFPAIADTAGGTTITIEGEGFLDDNVQCDFDGSKVPATYISSRELRCNAPVGGNEQCEGVPLEVSIGKDRFTRNLITIRRVSSPRIVRVYTVELEDPTRVDMDSYGNMTGGIWHIALEGYGFQSSPMLGCRIKSDNANDAQYSYLSDVEYAYYAGSQGMYFGQAVFVNSTRMTCILPAFPNPTLIPARIELTLDRTVFSRAGNKFEVVGPPIGLSTFAFTDKVWNATFNVNLPTSNHTDIPTLYVWTVDSVGHRLRKLDLTTRRIQVRLIAYYVPVTATGKGWSNCDRESLPVSPPMPILYSTIDTTQTTVKGVTSFSGLYLLRPPSGTYTLEFTDLDTQWKHQKNITINIGEPYRLRICRQPPLHISNTAPLLSPPPMVYLEDISGNQMPAAVLSQYLVRVYYAPQSTYSETESGLPATSNLGQPLKPLIVNTEIKMRAGTIQDDFIAFEGMEMTGLYGSTYTLEFFVAQSVSRPHSILNVTSKPMSVLPCADRTAIFQTDPNTVMLFSKNGTSECFRCPAHGWCTGNEFVKVRDNNWWRPSNDSYLFYDCSDPYSGDSCLAPEGTCKTGYTGPRCSVCALGFGSQGRTCIPCVNEASMITLVALAIAVGLVFCAVVIYLSLNSTSKDRAAILLKMILNHMQVASRIADIRVPIPSMLAAVLQYQKKASEVARLDLAAVQCPPLYLTYYQTFYFLMAIPGILAVLFGVFFAFMKVVKVTYAAIKSCFKKKEEPQPEPAPPVANPLARLRGKVKAIALTKAHLNDMAGQATDEQIDNAKIRSVSQYYMASLIVILFIVFPSVLSASAYMVQCEDVAYGDGPTFHVVSYLTQDRSIDCSTSTHQNMIIVAIAFAAFYGFGTPFLAFVLVRYNWMTYGWRATRKLFMFLVAGYAKEVWWWECIVLLRKAAIVFGIAFVSNPYLQTYIAMWAMSVALGLHVAFQPFEDQHRMFFYLEGVSIGSVTLTLNLLLLYNMEEFQESVGGPKYMVLTYGLVALNVIVIFVMIYLFIFNVLKKIWRWIKACFHIGEVKPHKEEDPIEADDKVMTTLNDAVAATQRRRSSCIPGIITPTSKRDEARKSLVVPMEDPNETSRSVVDHAGDEGATPADSPVQAMSIAEQLAQEVEDLQNEAAEMEMEEAAIDDAIIQFEAQLPTFAGQIAREEALSAALEDQLKDFEEEDEEEEERR